MRWGNGFIMPAPEKPYRLNILKIEINVIVIKVGKLDPDLRRIASSGAEKKAYAFSPVKRMYKCNITLSTF